MKGCVILGGGGHAKVVIDVLLRSKAAKPVGILDSAPGLKGQKLQGIPVLGNDEMLASLKRKGISIFIVGLGGARDNGPRQRLFEKALTYGLKPVAAIDPSAVCSRFAKVGEGSIILPLAVINAGAVVGQNVIVNTSAVIEHDCHIGSHVHVATGAKLASGVSVGEGTHIGAGAVIRQLIAIGKNAVIGAGAAVIKDVEDDKIVVGVPAKVLRKVS